MSRACPRLVVAAACAVLVFADASAQGFGSAQGELPGGTLSTTPGVGGVGVPGQVPGGTLSTRRGVGGYGVPMQVPGGTLVPRCNGGPCPGILLVPGIVVPVPGAESPGTAIRSDGASPSPAEPPEVAPEP